MLLHDLLHDSGVGQRADVAQVGHRLATEFGVSIVDINFGCPVRQVTERAKSGSYLLKHPDKMYEIISKVVQACSPTPVTAKIRRAAPATR